MFQLNLAIVIITTLVLAGFGLYNYRADFKTKQKEIEQRLVNTTNRLALSLSLPLYNLDQKTIEKIILSEMQNDEIISIHYFESWTEKVMGYTRDDQGIASTSEVAIPPNSLNNKQTIRFNEQVLGDITVIVTLDLMTAEMNKLLRNDISQMILIDISLVILMILTLRLRIIRPILSLTHSASEITKGKLDKEITVSGNDEIGTLAKSLLSMRDSLKNQISNLQEENAIRKRAEKALRESEEKYRMVIDNSMEAICIQQQGYLKYFNPESIRLFGYSEAELKHLSIEKILFPEDRSVALSHFQKTEQGETTDQRQTYRIINKEGDTIWIENKAVTISWENQPAALMFISDITERIRTEELIIQTEKMMSIGGLAAGMAHEINNPLSAILQGTQNIIRRFSPEFPKNKHIAQKHGLDLMVIRDYLEEREILSYLKGIQTSGKRAADIISNMLQFSRKSESKIVQTDLATLIDNTIELAYNDYDLKKKYDFKKIEITREYSSDTQNFVAPCTQTEIEQVILNLLKNSAQALINAKREEPKINIRISQEPAYVRIEIEDNGPGIEESIRKRIFEPFYTTKPVGEGTGLGLSVSYMIVTNNHQGTLEVESEEGKGSKFIIRLPRERL